MENSGGLGRYLAGRLAAAGESVVDVPPKLSARVRVLFSFAGNSRKNDGLDALATAFLAASLNYALHMVATSQARSNAPGGTYYRKKIDEGKSRKEALRCLKRRVCDAVYKSLVADSQAPSRSAA